MFALVFLVFCWESQSQIFINAKTQTMYAKTTVNIRDKPNTHGKIVGRVYWNEKVKIIQKENKKWYSVNYKGKKNFICVEYLKNKRQDIEHSLLMTRQHLNHMRMLRVLPITHQYYREN